jgi:hypothetical protein
MPVKLRRFWIQLTSDRKRFGLLCAVIGMAMLLWARLIVVSRMPRMAIADEAAVSANDSQEPGASSGSANLASTAAAILPVTLESHTERDPFVISPRYFPRPTSIADLGHAIDKSAPNAAEEPMQTQARITAQLRALTEKLRLEAAMNGSFAVINGRTFRVGEVVAVPSESAVGEPVPFRLKEVGQRSATLEYEGRQFEIRMNTP